MEAYFRDSKQKQSKFGTIKQVHENKYPNDVLIIVQSHDAASFDKACKLASQYPWAFPVLVPDATENNPLFENRLFMLYDEVVKPLLGPDIKYIGQIAYRADKKINVKGLDMAIRNGAYKAFDAIMMRMCDTTIANDAHPHLVQLWNEVVEPVIGLNHSQVNCMAYYNYWFAKKEVYEDYVHILKTEVVPRILKHPMAFKDAKYKNDYHTKDSLLKQCGVPWFPHIPFVLERFVYPFMKSKLYTIGLVGC